jgi:DNA polymerase eta
MVRLGVPEDQPLAVQQWQGLIAINYPARKHGLGRHITSSEAKKLCPDIILQHVATWKEGESKWAYHDDAYNHMGTHKVSLDPYRLESRKILATIKEVLPPAPLQKVEKASIDEVFLDLSAQVHSIMLERFPELRGPAPYDDVTEPLPHPPTTALDWDTDALVDLDEKETEEDDPDWDDISMLIGSEIVRTVRKAIRERLKYTCSGGIARNKMLAKLGSGHKKPNQQTIIRNRGVQQFLSGFKFTKIRNLGGKLGDEVVKVFDTDQVSDLLRVPLEQLTKKLDDDVGVWLYGVIRGEDTSEVTPRTQIKSMLSAKSFRPAINDIQAGQRWLRIFAADIFSRCVEEGVLENKRRPRTINLHHRCGGITRSKQSPIPQPKSFTEELLYDLARTLFVQIVADGRAWPCTNLSLSVGGFEDGVAGNKGIGGFLVYGEEAKAIMDSERHLGEPQYDSPEFSRSRKRRKVENNGIHRFFIPNEDSRGSDSGQSPFPGQDNVGADSDPDELYNTSRHPADVTPPPDSPRHGNQPLHQQTIDMFFCSRCNAHLPLESQTEHEDWHVAKDLANEWKNIDRANNVSTNAPQKSTSKPQITKSKGRPPKNTYKDNARGQTKLTFEKG